MENAYEADLGRDGDTDSEREVGLCVLQCMFRSCPCTYMYKLNYNVFGRWVGVDSAFNDPRRYS